MNVLAVGNSFSQDACRYLSQIARADGQTIHVTNLYIGGCPLSHHYRNLFTEKSEYTIEQNGSASPFQTSLKNAFLAADWDVITVQQVSHESPNYETYQPYLNALAEYIRKLCPRCRLLVHQTWAYEEGSRRLCEELGYASRKDMFRDIQASYAKAAADIHADGIIPSGELFERLTQKGFSIHRDTFHASLGAGRYALGLLWYQILTGNDVAENTFSDFDEEISAEQISLIKECVRGLSVRAD